MKILFTALLLTNLYSLSLYPQWFLQNLPYYFTLRSNVFINTSDGWAVCDNGKILKTTDGGTTWTIQSSGITQNLYGVTFTDANNGTAVGEIIIRTTDEESIGQFRLASKVDYMVYPL